MNHKMLYVLICSLFITCFCRLQADEPLNIIIVDEQGCEIDPVTLDILVEDLESSSWISKVGESLFYLFDKLREKFWGEEQIRHDLDFIEQEFVGGNFLRMAGYYSEPPEVGVDGGGEIHSKVRITTINGILNNRKDVLSTTKLISETHGGTNVYYVFRPTLGWAWDIVKSTLVKSGFISQQARDIASIWKNLILEMGGVDSGGSIIHYAHSIGAADTYSARSLLSPEEIAMISVFTFGSPIIFPDEGFHLVRNYASVRDGVPLLRRTSLGFGNDDVVYVGSYSGKPFVDHLLDSPNYRAVLTMLGQEFLEAYTGREAEIDNEPMVYQ